MFTRTLSVIPRNHDASEKLFKVRDPWILLSGLPVKSIFLFNKHIVRSKFSVHSSNDIPASEANYFSSLKIFIYLQLSEHLHQFVLFRTYRPQKF